MTTLSRNRFQVELLFVLRLFVYLGLIAIVVAVVMFLFTRRSKQLPFTIASSPACRRGLR